MQNKKYSVLVDTFHLYQALTGIKTYTTELCRGLEAIEDDNIQYVTFPYWKKALQSSFLRGSTSPYIKLLNHFLFFTWKLIVLPIYVVMKRIDVVISPDFVAPMFVSKRVITMPVIHDLFFWEMPSNYNPIWRPYFLWMIRRGINNRSVLLTTSEYIKKKIQDTFHYNIPVEVAYQSYRQPASHNHEIVLSQIHPVLKPENYFLHAGVFDVRKNIPFLIKGFSRYLTLSGESKYLVLVGSAGLSMKHDDWKTCKQLIDELSLNENVIMPGFVDDAQLECLYKNAFSYIFPSKEEGFGIPVLEAMYHGSPVIVSKNGPLTEVGGEAVLSFDPDNLNELVDCMFEIREEEKRQTLIKKGNEQIKKYSSNHFAATVHQIIKTHIVK